MFGSHDCTSGLADVACLQVLGVSWEVDSAWLFDAHLLNVRPPGPNLGPKLAPGPEPKQGAQSCALKEGPKFGPRPKRGDHGAQTPNLRKTIFVKVFPTKMKKYEKRKITGEN